MKETLRERIEKRVFDLREYTKTLDRIIDNYANSGNFFNAAENKVRRDTYELIADNLEQLLKD